MVSDPALVHSRHTCYDDTRLLSVVDVIIPALNEEESLPLVLKDLPNVRNVFVVDNGSTDNTGNISSQLGALVVTQPVRGYGSACLRGLSEIENRTASGARPPEIVVFLDADYSDHPEFLIDLVKPIASGKFDMVLGSRMMGDRDPGSMPLQSVLGNGFACLMMRLLFRVSYTDLGPFRAINYSKLCELDMVDEDFGWTIEMQIKAARAHLRTHEVPVPYRKRIGQSKISGTIIGSIKAGAKILFTIAKYGVRRNRKDSDSSDQELRSIPSDAGRSDQAVA